MALAALKWTLDDYHLMIDAGILDGRPVELLNGEIIEMSPEGEPHASASVEAGEYLMQLLGDRAQVHPAKPITFTHRQFGTGARLSDRGASGAGISPSSSLS